MTTPPAVQSDDLRTLRRARREARRAKQRHENVGRSQKMHAARITGGLSAQGPSNSLAGLQARTLHIGCSGWYYWHWKGLFYPESLPSNRWFDHYAGRFRTVELNAPFYSWPTVQTVRTWVRQAGRRQFIYTVKVPELITHTKRFQGVKTLIRDFGLVADILGPRMGCFLYQLPPSFYFTPARLKSIVTQLDPSRRNVVEFRHRTWWNEVVYRAFRDSGIIFCSCSGPRLPDELIKTSDEIYVRFHGTKQWYRHNYTLAELGIWAKRIQDAQARRVWVYFNNDRDGFAIKNARSLLRLLKSSPAASRN